MGMLLNIIIPVRVNPKYFRTALVAHGEFDVVLTCSGVRCISTLPVVLRRCKNVA